MGVMLEIQVGAGAGKTIGLKKGQSVTVGRAAGKAQFALSEDTFMSGLHFAVECTASGCRVFDRKSSNGTFLNGAKIQEAMLANGDEIKAGQTVFHVKIVADQKLVGMTLQQPVAPAASRPAQPDKLSAPPREAERPERLRSSDPPARQSEPAPPERVAGKEPGRAEPPRRVEQSPLTAEPARSSDAEVSPPAAKFPPVQEPPDYNAHVKAAPPAKIDAPHAEPPPKSRDDFWAAPEAEKASLAGAPERREIASPPVDFEKVAGADARRASGPRAPAAESPVDRGTPPRPGTAGGAVFKVMGWSFPPVPPGWLVQEGFGLQSVEPQEFPSSVAATEEGLVGITLQQFVESQISMLRGYLRDAKIEPTIPPRVQGADESMGVDVRHATKDGTELAYRHIYARSGSSVGVLTVTTLASEFQQVLQSLQPLLEGAAFHATVSTS